MQSWFGPQVLKAGQVYPLHMMGPGRTPQTVHHQSG
jgi:hypothetical protein